MRYLLNIDSPVQTTKKEAAVSQAFLPRGAAYKTNMHWHVPTKIATIPPHLKVESRQQTSLNHLRLLHGANEAVRAQVHRGQAATLPNTQFDLGKECKYHGASWS